MRCPQCGFDTPDDMSFCTNCGAKLKAAAPSSTPTGATNLCPQCGSQMRPEARFCDQCGVSLTPAHPPYGSVSTPEGTVRKFLKAMEARSVSGMAARCTGQEKADTLEGGSGLFAGIDKIGISLVKAEVVAQSKDEATVKATYQMEVTMGGQTKRRYHHGYVDLVKVDGEWLIEKTY